MSSDFPFDIAFSLLDRDEPVAKEIARLLEPATVFLYSERQAELVGSDGVEKFSAMFRRDARTVAVLHRADWGNTKWTGIEKTAIVERLLEEGADFVTFIRLDESNLPGWMPRARIFGDFNRLGVNGVAGALLERLRQAGSLVRQETAKELAQRLADEQLAEAHRVHFLRSAEGVKVATQLALEVIAKLYAMGADIGAAATAERGEVVNLYRQGFSVSASWQCPYIDSLRNSALHVVEWNGRPDIGGRFYRESPPEELAHWRFTFDRPTPEDYVWVDASTGRRVSSASLPDFAARLLLNRVREAHKESSRLDER
jgi:hypothetical protein